MGRNHPVGIFLAAVLFGALYQGGSQLSFDMPKINRDMVVVIQGLVILFCGAMENVFLASPLRRGVPARFGRQSAIALRPGCADGNLHAHRPAAGRHDSRGDAAAARGAGGMFSERSGVIDLGLEGKMLGAAFAAAAVSAVTGSAWLGLGAGIATAVALALLIGFACITHRGNQVVAGMAVNIMVAGLGPTLALAWFNLGGQTPQLDGPGQRFLGLVWPWAQTAREHPFPGLLYAELLSGHNLIVYFAAALVPFSAWVLYRTRFGLRLRAVGENPHAVDTAGISVNAAALPGGDHLRRAVRRGRARISRRRRARASCAT